ncbi:MAG: STAS domain-containing protein [Roseococcus sp.]|nr:STAS domain-containing protein [Roseococcus sp.]
MTAFARIAADTLKITPQFSLDAEGSLKLRPVLESLAKGSAVRARRVVLDLSEVDHMDGSGIGAIAFLRKRLLAAGLSLDLSGAHGQPLALLRKLGLARSFGLAEDRPSFWANLLRPLPGNGWRGAQA